MRTRSSVLVGCVTALVLGLAGLAAAGPVGLTGNVLWLDAGDIDGNGVPDGLADGTAVPAWTDKSTGGNNFSQGTAARQPVVRTGVLGGQPVVQLDGGDDYLTGPAVLTGNDDDYTYIVLWQPHKNTGVQSPYEQAGPGVGARSAVLAVGNRYGFNGQNNDRHDLVPFGPNVWRLSAMEVENSATNNIRLYDNAAPSAGATSNPGALNIGTAGSTIGTKQQSQGGELLDGDIAEVLVYDRTLTSSELNQVGSHLNSKYNLGVAHRHNPWATFPVHRWSFNDGTADDSVGGADGTLNNGASIVGGRLQLDGVNDYVRTSTVGQGLFAKTLMAWVSPANLSQRAGGVLTLEDPTGSDTFDSIVYGELTAGQWMNGSDFGRRSNGTDNGGPLETVTDPGEVMLAITYELDGSIAIYRNGLPYASYQAATPSDQPVLYDGSLADGLLGLRHADRAGDTGGTATGNDVFWAGWINEARLYNYALTPEQIRLANAAGPDELYYPEPASLTLFGLGGLALWRRRRRANTAR
jgi:MYXO-CTERM domain-containing protein